MIEKELEPSSTMEHFNAEWKRLYSALPHWQRVALQELRTKVLLQAIRDAHETEFPPSIRAALNQVEFYIETHQGIWKDPKA